jgi:hypothetical protein
MRNGKKILKILKLDNIQKHDIVSNISSVKHYLLNNN